MSEDLKKIVAQLIQQFTQVETGNKITENNMMALHMKLNMAIDGQITIKAPEGKEGAE